MPPDFFTPPSIAQFNASVTQPMAPQTDASATQPMVSQQGASAAQPTAQNTWSPQMVAQANADDPTTASRDPAPAQVSFRNSNFKVSSSGWSQLGFP